MGYPVGVRTHRLGWRASAAAGRGAPTSALVETVSRRHSHAPVGSFPTTCCSVLSPAATVGAGSAVRKAREKSENGGEAIKVRQERTLGIEFLSLGSIHTECFTRGHTYPRSRVRAHSGFKNPRLGVKQQACQQPWGRLVLFREPSSSDIYHSETSELGALFSWRIWSST